jgi:DNA-binding IclR family transcriptional regulator
VDERSLQLLKAMREQVGDTTGRAVDAGAAAKSLGMYPGILDRCLLYLVRAGYIEEYADRTMTTQGLYLITFQGIAATTLSPNLLQERLRRAHGGLGAEGIR